MSFRDILLWDRGLAWDRIGSADGDASGIPTALDSLANATNAEEAQAAYWLLDNVVVLQGSVYEGAVAILDSLIRLLVSKNGTSRRECLELFLQIVGGWTDPSERSRTGRDLAEESRNRLRPLAPVFLAYVNDDSRHVRETAFEIIVRLRPNDAEIWASLEWVVSHTRYDDERAFYSGLLRG